MASNNTPYVKYVYELPYMVNRELCRILDQSEKWEELAGQYMGFRMLDIQSLRMHRTRSPSEELLQLWGQKNHTVHELFVLLSQMQHYQAMVVLKPFIDAKYHVLISEGEENMSRLLGPLLRRQASEASGSLDGNENLNYNIPSCSAPTKKCEEKILNVPRPSAPPGRQREDGAAPRAQQSKVDPPPPPSSPSSHRGSEDSTMFTDASVCGSIPQISYKELYVATNQWDKRNILGRGGFGIVFRGTWKNTQVAIKRIEQRGGSEAAGGSYQAQLEQSSKELKILNSVRHDNVLPLYGFSVGGEQPCLVYQLMPNGSLEDRLQCRGGTAPLSWLKRHNIARGSARGLQFLHTMGDKPLIHGDIKSANILLDANWQPRIGDFGLAREGPIAKYTHIQITKVHGTRPYLPQDFLRSKQISTKVDTYSFGIVLFEIATGQRAFDEHRKEHKLLLDLVRKSDRSLLMDPRAPADPHPLHPSLTIFHELLGLGLRCTESLPKSRPEMVQVLQELENLEEQRTIGYCESPAQGPASASPRLQGSLRVEIPTQEAGQHFQLTPRFTASPGLSPNPQRPFPQHPSYASISPSFMIQDFASTSIPSTQPTMNPFLSPTPSPQFGGPPHPFPSPGVMRESPLLRDQRADSSYSSEDSRPQSYSNNVDSSSQPSVLIPTIIPGVTEPQPEGAAVSSYIPAFSLLCLGDPEPPATPPEVPSTARPPGVHSAEQRVAEGRPAAVHASN